MQFIAQIILYDTTFQKYKKLHTYAVVEKILKIASKSNCLFLFLIYDYK